MKLLLDENLSPTLVRPLLDPFPGSAQVEDCGLGTAEDWEIWRFAKENDFATVSKESDFCNRAAVYGGPPKVIWLRVGNCTSAEIEALLKRSKSAIEAFAESPQTTLVIFRNAAVRVTRRVAYFRTEAVA